jgi:hypothetical protein
MKHNNAAMIGFLIALLLGFRSVAATAVGDCATNQPQMRKMFPIEMRILKKFEGIWSDTPYKKNVKDLTQRTFLINSNKNRIQMQIDTKNDVGETKTTPVLEAKVCKTENGLSLRADDIDMPILVLSHKEARFKVGKNWMPFFRIQEIHANFFPPKDDPGASTGTKARPAGEPPATQKTGTR